MLHLLLHGLNLYREGSGTGAREAASVVCQAARRAAPESPLPVCTCPPVVDVVHDTCGHAAEDDDTDNGCSPAAEARHGRVSTAGRGEKKREGKTGIGAKCAKAISRFLAPSTHVGWLAGGPNRTRSMLRRRRRRSARLSLGVSLFIFKRLMTCVMFRARKGRS